MRLTENQGFVGWLTTHQPQPFNLAQPMGYATLHPSYAGLIFMDFHEMKQNILVIVLCVSSIILGAVLTHAYYKYIDRDGFPMTWKEANEFGASIHESTYSIFVNQPTLDIHLDLEILKRLSDKRNKKEWAYLIEQLENRLEGNTYELERRIDSFPKTKVDKLTMENLAKAKERLKSNRKKEEKIN